MTSLRYTDTILGLNMSFRSKKPMHVIVVDIRHTDTHTHSYVTQMCIYVGIAQTYVIPYISFHCIVGT